MRCLKLIRIRRKWLLMAFVLFSFFLCFRDNIIGTSSNARHFSREIHRTYLHKIKQSSPTLPGNIDRMVKELKIPNTTFLPAVKNKSLWTKYLRKEDNFCTERFKNLSTLICVHTAPSHFLYRSVIRNTWGSKDLHGTLQTATLFFIGKTKDDDVSSSIRWESHVYEDIVQGDYIDTYHTLTYKAVNVLQWISKYCPRVHYVVKVDDDVFVNVYSLRRFIHKIRWEHGSDSKMFFCNVKTRSVINRSQTSKWYVDNNFFRGEKVYPPYCLGYAFLMPVGVVFDILKVVEETPYFWIDDVYVTGLLAQKVNVSHKHIGQYTVISPKLWESKLLYGDAIFGHIHGSDNLYIRENFWRKIKEIEV